MRLAPAPGRRALPCGGRRRYRKIAVAACGRHLPWPGGDPQAHRPRPRAAAADEGTAAAATLADLPALNEPATGIAREDQHLLCGSKLHRPDGRALLAAA